MNKEYPNKNHILLQKPILESTRMISDDIFVIETTRDSLNHIRKIQLTLGMIYALNSPENLVVSS